MTAALELRFNGWRQTLPIPSIEWTGALTVNFHQGRLTDRGNRLVTTRYACRACGSAAVTAFEVTEPVHPLPVSGSGGS